MPGDGAVLFSTTRELAKSHGVLETLTATPDDFEFALFRDDPVIGALIAFFDGEPAGTVVWHRSFSTNRGKETMYLEDLSVLPAFRRKGIAKVLLQETAKLALRKGYPSIYWLRMDWNEAARELYAKAGAHIEPGNSFCRIDGDALKELAA